MKKSHFLYYLTISLSSVCIGTASAATWQEKSYNPHPLSEDVVLPMPCNGKMVFRVIGTGTKDPLEDKSIILGSEDSPESYAGYTMPSYIAGGFVNKNKERYFLLAKYETSKLQYDAVMQKDCPTESIDNQKPISNISWFDAIEFTRRYSEWLLKNAKQQLPKEDKVSGFVRLPTNNEWEYAARGGNLVSESEFRGFTFPLGDNELYLYASFAGAQSSNGKLQVIGKPDYPNPLGLFDMLGNVSEMMIDSFKVNKIDHYHGQTGSISVRGGHYLTSEEDLSTSLKNEFPLYAEDGSANKAAFVGFRVAISAPMVLTSREKTQQLSAAWAELGQDSNASAASPQQASNSVNKIVDLSKTVDDKKLKKELQEFQNQLRAANQNLEEQRSRAISNNLEYGGFLCAAIAETSMNYKQTKEIADKTLDILNDIEDIVVTTCQESSAEECDEAKKLQQQKIAESSPSLEKAKTEKNILDELSRSYAHTLVNIEDNYSMKAIQQQLERLSFKKAKLKLFTEIYWRHIQQYVADKKIARDAWVSECTQQHSGNPLTSSN